MRPESEPCPQHRAFEGRESRTQGRGPFSGLVAPDSMWAGPDRAEGMCREGGPLLSPGPLPFLPHSPLAELKASRHCPNKWPLFPGEGEGSSPGLQARLSGALTLAPRPSLWVLTLGSLCWALCCLRDDTPWPPALPAALLRASMGRVASDGDAEEMGKGRGNGVREKPASAAVVRDPLAQSGGV